MSVTLHTDLGTLKLEIYCDIVPRTSFNFLALAASGYYDNTLFHRNIKGFMLQGGDPTGSGKGGESIWGGKFPDEIRSELTHSARGILSTSKEKTPRGACMDNAHSIANASPAPLHQRTGYTLAPSTHAVCCAGCPARRWLAAPLDPHW